MKWTPEGKKIGDKVAGRSGLGMSILKITGETKTQWIVGKHRIMKQSGRFVGTPWASAYDCDDELMATLESEKVHRESLRKRDCIRKWVVSTPADEVVALLWGLVGPKIEGFIPGDVQ